MLIKNNTHMGHHHAEVGDGQVHHEYVGGRPQGLRLK
jgi:hypothetical protein